LKKKTTIQFSPENEKMDTVQWHPLPGTFKGIDVSAL